MEEYPAALAGLGTGVLGAGLLLGFVAGTRGRQPRPRRGRGGGGGGYRAAHPDESAALSRDPASLAAAGMAGLGGPLPASAGSALGDERDVPFLRSYYADEA